MVNFASLSFLWKVKGSPQNPLLQEVSAIGTCPQWSQRLLEESTVGGLPTHSGFSYKLCLPLKLLVGLSSLHVC